MKIKNRCFQCFAALSVKTRVEIVKLLQINDRLAVTEIVEHFKLTQPTVTHHLKYLKKTGILNSRKEGRQVYYFLNSQCDEKCIIFSLS